VRERRRRLRELQRKYGDTLADVVAHRHESAARLDELAGYEARIASGGELSRILLALKSVASLDARGKTLVFDEVDAGIGGRVAEVVGRKLRDMAQRQQVLCVTHLPQIASMADRHLVVRKQVERGRTTTEVGVLDASERVEEVARMLGGETVTDAARRHAREMVRQARA